MAVGNMKLFVGALIVFYNVVLWEKWLQLKWWAIERNHNKSFQETIPYRDNEAYLKLISYMSKVISEGGISTEEATDNLKAIRKLM